MYDNRGISFLNFRITKAVAVVILVPPAAPITSLTLPSFPTIMEGHMEDNGRFPPLIKLFGDGGTPKKLVILGAEKSSISSL